MLRRGVTQVQIHQRAEIRVRLAAELRSSLKGQRLCCEFLHKSGHSLFGIFGITAVDKLDQSLHSRVRRHVERLLHCWILCSAGAHDTDYPAWLSEHNVGKEVRAPRCHNI